MARTARRVVNTRKALVYVVIVNLIQVIGVAAIAVLSLSTGGHALNGVPEQMLLSTLALMVAWGAVLDTREALTACSTADEADMLESAYRQTEALNGTLRAQRHDFMNHLQVVYSLIELGEYDSASQYIDQVYGDIRKVGRTLKTAHPSINALLAAKAADGEAQGVRMTLNVESDWADLPMESWTMCRVLGNLIDNALDALKGVSDPSLEIRLGESVQSYTFAVVNNGPMIPANTTERIFARGFSTKGEGRGMGLAIVRELMTAAGGTIVVRSDERETAFEGILKKADVSRAAV